MTVQDNLLALLDTIGIFECYNPDSSDEPYDSYMSKIKECRVFLPEDIEKLKGNSTHQAVPVFEHCQITCEDEDTFTMARNIYNRNELYDGKDGKVLVLNFANPYNPGGGVWKGANAQEEDLCRRSNLLLSLESEEAKEYYQYNKANRKRDMYGNDYGNNSMILSPMVKIIKDKNYRRFVGCPYIGVLTAAAPIILDKQHISDEYLDIFFERINSVLLCAAHYGYTHLILGAWGCGAFGNDSEVVARLFRDAIDNFNYNEKNVHQLFESITFAVPYNEKRPANHLEFKAQFENKS